MTRTTKILIAAVAVSLLALSLAWAQPGGRRGGGGGGGGMSAEQLFGYLALSPDIMLNDEQVLNVRHALRPSYADQLAMRDAMRGGTLDFQEVRETMADMQKDMIAAVSGSLSKEQNETLKGAMARMGGGGRRGGGGR
ncbi:MAG: hypothetical protein CME04_11155 [Gemmatimonadaceae bacterium]|nr:hypothetical protein [Gemmatimonadaceae bacterium]